MPNDGEDLRPSLDTEIEASRKENLKACLRNRQFPVKALESPPRRNLPKDWTEGQDEFKVVVVDFIGPLKFRKTEKVEEKA